MKILIIGKLKGRLFDTINSHEDIEALYIPNAGAITVEFPFEGDFFYNGERVQLSSFDAVVSLSMNSTGKTVSVFKTLCEKLGIAFVGSPIERSRLNNKTLCAVDLWSAGLPIAKTVWSFGFPDKGAVMSLGDMVVEKSPEGANGFDVSLLNLKNGKIGIKKSFLYQEYIEIGATDERWIIVGGKIASAMKRTAVNEGEFRSNLMQGGKGTKIPITKDMQELAKKIYDIYPNSVYFGADIFRVPDNESPNGYRFIVNELNSVPGEKIIGVTKYNHDEDIYKHIKELVNKFYKEKRRE